jgi:hypothetical protein
MLQYILCVLNLKSSTAAPLNLTKEPGYQFNRTPNTFGAPSIIHSGHSVITFHPTSEPVQDTRTPALIYIRKLGKLLIYNPIPIPNLSFRLPIKTINIRQLHLTTCLPRWRRCIPPTTIPPIKPLTITNAFLNTPSLLRNRTRLDPIQVRSNDTSIMRVGVFLAAVVWV